VQATAAADVAVEDRIAKIRDAAAIAAAGLAAKRRKEQANQVTLDGVESQPAPQAPARVVERVDFSGISSLAQLREAGADGASLLYNAAAAGQMGEVTALMAGTGEKLGKDDLLQQAGGDSVIGAIARNQQLGEIFTAGHWAGRIGDMRAVWEQVPTAEKAQLDGRDGRPSWIKILQETNRMSIQRLRPATPQSPAGVGIG